MGARLLRIARLQPLRGVNRYSRSSLLAGTLEMMTAAGATERGPAIERYQAMLGELGLPPASAPGEDAPLPRHVEAIAKTIRDGLGLDWASPEPIAGGEALFLIPLDPEELAAGIAELAVGIVAAALAGQLGHEGHRGRLQALQALLDRLRPDIQMRAVERECRRRGVPWRLLPWSGRITQIGEGSRQIRLDLTETSETRLHASRTASDKVASNLLLARHGLPVPRQVAIERTSEAWAAATRLGPPVVVKPRSGRKGKAVSTGLRQRAE